MKTMLHSAAVRVVRIL